MAHTNGNGTPKHGDSTRAVHAGTQRSKAHHSLTTPIIQSATYTLEDTNDLCQFMESKTWGDGSHDREEYGRYGNPTVMAVEKRLAALEGAEDAALYSSGMAAIIGIPIAGMGLRVRWGDPATSFRRFRLGA